MSVQAPARSVLIYGYGVMGRGVAGTFAAAGFDTRVRSSRAETLAAAHPGIAFSGELPEACPDLVLELVPENVEATFESSRHVQPRPRALGTSRL